MKYLKSNITPPMCDIEYLTNLIVTARICSMVESRAGKWQRYEQEDEFYKRVNWRRDRESLDLCLSGGRGFRAEFELARQLKTGEWDVLLPNASPDELREHLNALGLPLPYGFRKEFNQIDTSFQKSA